MKYEINIKGKTIKQVKKLNLSGCGLTEFPDNIFEYQNLTKLVLSNNKIKTIPKDILTLKKLQVLDLANNEIKVFQSAVFRLSKLRTLNVYGNKITKFPKQVFESGLKKIIVGKNPMESEEIENLRVLCEVVTNKNDAQVRIEPEPEKMNVKALLTETKQEIREMEKKHYIFISYSHKDAEWLEEVKVHIKPLERFYGIEEWDDQKLRTSDKWRERISQALNNATIAVLLISPYFVASDFIVNNELQPLLEIAEKKGVKIMPVMVSPCETIEESGLLDYQAPNGPDKTLIEMNKGEVHRTLSKLVKDIKSFIEKNGTGTGTCPKPKNQ